MLYASGPLTIKSTIMKKTNEQHWDNIREAIKTAEGRKRIITRKPPTPIFNWARYNELKKQLNKTT